MDEKLIANRIKGLRPSKKIASKHLAKMTGFTAGYISRIENSDKTPPISTLIRIATCSLPAAVPSTAASNRNAMCSVRNCA
jgi:transcriptional regulator with XRE-family HTH domain